jgi:hypothetical protein
MLAKSVKRGGCVFDGGRENAPALILVDFGFADARHRLLEPALIRQFQFGAGLLEMGGERASSRRDSTNIIVFAVLTLKHEANIRCAGGACCSFHAECCASSEPSQGRRQSKKPYFCMV